MSREIISQGGVRYLLVEVESREALSKAILDGPRIAYKSPYTGGGWRVGIVAGSSSLASYRLAIPEPQPFTNRLKFFSYLGTGGKLVQQQWLGFIEFQVYEFNAVRGWCREDGTHDVLAPSCPTQWYKFCPHWHKAEPTKEEVRLEAVITYHAARSRLAADFGVGFTITPTADASADVCTSDLSNCKIPEESK